MLIEEIEREVGKEERVRRESMTRPRCLFTSSQCQCVCLSVGVCTCVCVYSLSSVCWLRDEDCYLYCTCKYCCN